MSSTTEAYDLFSYEPSNVNETLKTASIAEERTAERGIVILRKTQGRAVASGGVEDTQFNGTS